MKVDLELEELKKLMIEYLVWKELLHILDRRMRKLQTWFAKKIIKENMEKLEKLGAKVSEKQLINIITYPGKTLGNYTTSYFFGKLEIAFESGFFIEVSNKENIKEIVELINSMIEEYRRKKNEDLVYQNVIKIYKCIEEKFEEICFKIDHDLL